MKKNQWLILSISHQNFKIENSFCFKSLFKIPIEYQYVLPVHVLYIYIQRQKFYKCIYISIIRI